ncbi:MAG: hypothetical protein FWF99_04630 [Desulfovibrionaceae bacterium]|nr:hypothetical protein [Desulfovibrionaceae bacterium]
MNNTEQPSPSSSGIFRENCFLALSLLLNLGLCLAIVWVHSMPYVTLSKAIREASLEHRKLYDLAGQLEAERDVLSNQASLEKKIRELNLDLAKPRPGQVRHLDQ